MKTLKPVEMTAENFKGYRRIINLGSGSLDAYNEEFKYWGKVS